MKNLPNLIVYITFIIKHLSTIHARRGKVHFILKNKKVLSLYASRLVMLSLNLVSHASNFTSDETSQ